MTPARKIQTSEESPQDIGRILESVHDPVKKRIEFEDGPYRVAVVDSMEERSV